MSVITPQQLSSLLSQVPAQTALHAPISVGAVPTATPTPGAPQPPSASMQNLAVNEKQDSTYYQPSPIASPVPPPAYGGPPTLPPLAQATALYAYNGTDPGDLSLQPNDHITVTEYMNAEWWKGRSSRTGQEGIFPRSYVRVSEDKAPQQNGQSNYGNMPLDVSGQGDGSGKVPGKGAEMGKKFGKKVSSPWSTLSSTNVPLLTNAKFICSWVTPPSLVLVPRWEPILSTPFSKQPLPFRHATMLHTFCAISANASLGVPVLNFILFLDSNLRTSSSPMTIFPECSSLFPAFESRPQNLNQFIQPVISQSAMHTSSLP